MSHEAGQETFQLSRRMVPIQQSPMASPRAPSRPMHVRWPAFDSKGEERSTEPSYYLIQLSQHRTPLIRIASAASSSDAPMTPAERREGRGLLSWQACHIAKPYLVPPLGDRRDL